MNLKTDRKDTFAIIDKKLQRNPSQIDKKWVIGYMRQLLRNEMKRHFRENGY